MPMNEAMTFARRLAGKLGRPLDEEDEDFIRFLVELAREIALPPAALRHRIRWHLTH